MAAPIWMSSVLRITLRGPGLVLAGGGRHLSHLSRPLATSWALTPNVTATTTLFPTQQVRHGSFFNKLTADELWRGVLAETGAGARKGRGKRTKRKVKKDLNRGQRFGEGMLTTDSTLTPANTTTPQLNINPATRRNHSSNPITPLNLNPNPTCKRKMKVKRERGWTGNSWGGISLGPPDPGPNGETYEDFDSRAIEVKNVFNMTAKEGRKRVVSCLVAVGNGNGAAGFAVGKAADRTTALRKAKNRAVHYLYFIERYNSHTIYHDINSTFKRTTLRMKKQNKGYGLHCHRAIITICKLIGIEDMYAKVSGSTNLLNITRALFQGLANQETHSDLAEKQKLHVVEFQSERGPLPLVVASPSSAVRKTPEPEDEIPDTKLDWGEVRAAQGMKRSVWANVKRTVW
ncbi:28S ribosomal protein S5, mitochondrial [Anguilla rostrata]|uniref:28S ribosomal protein S5, mitochondrial n=1 Tax=Anguilla rostrata TaxID=7938 RepID=UPI0030CD3902